MEEEMKAAGKTWDEVSWLAQDRDGWKKFASALCSTGSEDDDGDFHSRLNCRRRPLAGRTLLRKDVRLFSGTCD